jgi:hypothetical protein
MEVPVKPVLRKSWLGCALLLTAAPAAWGQGVHVVAGDGSGDFLQLQQAVDAAADGDVILVRPHTGRYAATVIAGKALTIVGDGAVRPLLEEVTVSDLAAGQAVRLRFLDLEGSLKPAPFFTFATFDALSLEDNAGCVWLEDLVLAGADGVFNWGDLGLGRIGLDVVASDGVVVVGCEVLGGDGAMSTGGTPFKGGHAVQLLDSRLAIEGTTCLGGLGHFGLASSPGAQGGAGVVSTASTVFASGATLIGGDTGFIAGTAFSATPTASGLVLVDASSAPHVATTVQAGTGLAPPGEPVASSGSPSSFDDLADDHRQLTLPAALREMASGQLTYSGQPGDLVLLLLSSEPDWRLKSGLKGVLHVDDVIATLFLGAADPAGSLVLGFSAPTLPPGVDALAGYAQPVVAETDGSLRLGAPSSYLILDASIPAP